MLQLLLWERTRRVRRCQTGLTGSSSRVLTMEAAVLKFSLAPIRLFSEHVLFIPIPIFLTNYSNPVAIIPNAPTTTGMTVTLFIANMHSIYFTGLYFSTFFSSSLSLTRTSPGIATPMIFVPLVVLSITAMSDLRASIIKSHWIEESHKILYSMYSMTPSGVCSYYFGILSELRSVLLTLPMHISSYIFVPFFVFILSQFATPWVAYNIRDRLLFRTTHSTNGPTIRHSYPCGTWCN